MFTRNTPKEEEQGFLSDSTLTVSSSSGNIFRKRPLSGAHISRRKQSKKISYSVPKKGLSNLLETKGLIDKKARPTRLPGRNIFDSSNMASPGSKGDGDNVKRIIKDDKVNIFTAAAMGDHEEPSESQGFPFKATPSGHYKLKPSQVVYESKNLSVVAADPQSVTLNITDSEALKADQENKTIFDNWQTTCLYTTVGKDLTYSDLETTSESEHGNQTSEISLAKMGFVNDNCIEWNKLTLPRKSDLKKTLLHNVLNMINPDIHVKIGKNTYKCHRIVLQCYSSFFTSKTASQIELPESSVPGGVFSVIYQWMLHMDTDSYRLLKRDNILQIFKAAQYLGIKELEEQCWAFMDNCEIFNEDKAFLLYLEARKHNNKLVMDLMVPRVQRFFLILVSSKEFVEFNVQEVCTFLDSNYICVHCEEEVFMAGVRWLRHDWAQRKSHAAQIMSCVRFGLMNPKLLLAMRRDKSSSEFKPIVNIAEVSKMVDDGLSIQMLKLCFMNEPPESIEKSKQNLNLVDPVPRNWASTDKFYLSYAEFTKDLIQYRSKQRLEIKQSRIKMQMEKVDKDDFLSSAVLPSETQKKIRCLHAGESSFMDCIPQDCIPQDCMPRETDMFRDLYVNDRSGNKGGRGKTKNDNMLSHEYDIYDVSAGRKKPNRIEQHYHTREHRDRNPYSGERLSLEEQDEAARKIQKAYRTHRRLSSEQGKSSVGIKEDEAARKIQQAYRNHSARKLSNNSRDVRDSRNVQGYRDAYGFVDKSLRWRSRSDPSLPTGLTKSSTHPAGKYENDYLPLRVEKESVFIFGGTNPFDDCDQTGDCIFYYHTDCNEWRSCGRMPEPRHYHSIAFFQGKIYVAGGKHPAMFLTEPGAISSKVWKYDPQRKAWSRVKDMIFARRSFGLVACNGKLYVVGGRDEHDRIMLNVERYDMVSNSWSVVAPMKQARAGAAISEFQGRIWAAGGLVSDNAVATNTVECYDCQQNIWTLCSSLRYTLAYGVMVPVNNRIFLVGGAIGLQDSDLRGSGKQIDVWHQESQTWCMAAMMSKPRHAHTAVYLRGGCPDTGYMFIMGGMSTRHRCVTDHVECWRVKDEQWIMGVAPLPSAMSGAAALVLPSKTFG